MASGGAPFDDGAEELHNWTAPNCSLEDRLNNMVRTSQKSARGSRITYTHVSSCKRRYILAVPITMLFSRTGGCSRRRQIDLQRRTGKNSLLPWWRAALRTTFHLSPPLELAAGEHALLTPSLMSNTLLKCLSQTRLSWTSCARE